MKRSGEWSKHSTSVQGASGQGVIDVFRFFNKRMRGLVSSSHISSPSVLWCWSLKETRLMIVLVFAVAPLANDTGLFYVEQGQVVGRDEVRLPVRKYVILYGGGLVEGQRNPLFDCCISAGDVLSISQSGIVATAASRWRF